MLKKFHVARETTVREIIEVEALNIDDAISRIALYEGRLLNTIETQPVIATAWEKPTGISEPND